ncbi:MAG: VTT domain-containing protein [Lachnospiraceae bacterium]|nr:VTT domain-containing protein [Lachnospiraceae bacterium]
MWKKIKNYIQFVIIIVSIVTVAYLFGYRGVKIRDVLLYAEHNHLKIFLLLMSLYALKACCGIIPYSGLNIAAAMSFPLWQAILINALGTVVCFSISYLFGRMTRTERLEAKLAEHPKLARYMEGAREDEWALCFALHIAGLSSEVIGILFGIMRMPYGIYLGSAVLGVFPGMVCVSISGGTKDFTSLKFWFFYSINLLTALLGFAVLGLRVRKHRRLKKEKDAAEKAA